MRNMELLVKILDDGWGHKWESLTEVLDGISEEAAAWQAPCYRSVPREEHWPSPGSIHWQVAHIAACKREYTGILQCRGQAPASADAPYRPASFAEDVECLKRAHEAQRRSILELSDEDLSRTVSGGMTLLEFLSMCLRHDIWHASQIAVAKRLWLNR